MDEKKPWERRRKSFFDDFFLDMREFDEMFHEMMKGLESEDFRKGKPLTMGFSIKFNQDGKPIIREFGNIQRGQEGKPVVAEAREPLVDVVKAGNEIIITAEMPGVEKKDIRADVIDKTKVEISARSKGATFHKIIDTEEKLEKKPIKMSFNNGILELTYKKKKGLLGKIKKRN